MNKFLSEAISINTAPFNHDVVHGLATKWIATADDYVISIINNSIHSAPDTLKFHGIRRVSAREEYQSLSANSKSKVNYDMARYDVYKTELMFTYKGEPIPGRYLYLPFVDDGGIITITDTKYSILPVLTDTVISPGSKGIFVRLLRDKLMFHRENRNILMNGRVYTGQVIWANTVNTKNRDLEDNLGKVVPPAAIYTIAKYGIKKTFQKYMDSEVIVSLGEPELDNPDDYHIFTTTGIPPKLKESYYKPHNLHIAVPINKLTPMMENVITAVIYTFDVLPDRAKDMVRVINNGNVIDETKYWKIILSQIIFKNAYTIDRGYADIEDHFISLKSYVDNFIKSKLEENGIVVEDFFDLIMVLLDKFNYWMLNAKEYNSNVYNKYLDVLYYILYYVIIGINRMIYEIAKKSAKRELTINEVTNIMNNNLRLREFFKIKSGMGVSLSLSLIDYPGDNLYFKITSLLALQEQGQGIIKKKESFPSTMRNITADDLYMGSVYNLPKKTPSPKVRINPWVLVNINNGRIIPNPKFEGKLKKLDTLLKGKLETDVELNEVDSTDDLDTE